MRSSHIASFIAARPLSLGSFDKRACLCEQSDAGCKGADIHPQHVTLMFKEMTLLVGKSARQGHGIVVVGLL